MKKYTGKTLNDVLNSAAKEKGVSVEELTYFVTEENKDSWESELQSPLRFMLPVMSKSFSSIISASFSPV